MIRFVLCVVLATVIGGVMSALAAAQRPSQPLDRPLLADLDGDGTNETVRARETACFNAEAAHPPPCAPDDLRTFVVEVADSCAGGAGQVALTLSREMEYVSIGGSSTPTATGARASWRSRSARAPRRAACRRRS